MSFETVQRCSHQPQLQPLQHFKDSTREKPAFCKLSLLRRFRNLNCDKNSSIVWEYYYFSKCLLHVKGSYKNVITQAGDGVVTFVTLCIKLLVKTTFCVTRPRNEWRHLRMFPKQKPHWNVLPSKDCISRQLFYYISFIDFNLVLTAFRFCSFLILHTPKPTSLQYKFECENKRFEVKKMQQKSQELKCGWCLKYHCTLCSHHRNCSKPRTSMHTSIYTIMYQPAFIA